MPSWASTSIEASCRRHSPRSARLHRAASIQQQPGHPRRPLQPRQCRRYLPSAAALAGIAAARPSGNCDPPLTPVLRSPLPQGHPRVGRHSALASPLPGSDLGPIASGPFPTRFHALGPYSRPGGNTDRAGHPSPRRASGPPFGCRGPGPYPRIPRLGRCSGANPYLPRGGLPECRYRSGHRAVTDSVGIPPCEPADGPCVLLESAAGSRQCSSRYRASFGGLHEASRRVVVRPARHSAGRRQLVGGHCPRVHRPTPS